MSDSANEITTLTFTPDNPCNTTITSPAGDVLYRVVTEHKEHTVTSVRNAQDEAIATLEWHEQTSDKVTIRDSKTVAFSDWLKKSHIPFTE
jgi:hypothetical protein